MGYSLIDTTTKQVYVNLSTIEKRDIALLTANTLVLSTNLANLNYNELLKIANELEVDLTSTKPNKEALIETVVNDFIMTFKALNEIQVKALERALEKMGLALIDETQILH